MSIKGRRQPFFTPWVKKLNSFLYADKPIPLVERWAAGAGAGLTWTDAVTGSTLNSLAFGSAVLSDIQIDNSIAKDMFADLSIVTGSIAMSANNSYLPSVGVYIFPLNKDGTTYGDGRTGTFAVGSVVDERLAPYFAGVFTWGWGIAATQSWVGYCRGVVLPPDKFKFVIRNVLGDDASGRAFAATGNTIQYISYNRRLA